MLSVYDEMTGWELGNWDETNQEFTQRIDLGDDPFTSGLQQAFSWNGDIYGWIGDHMNNSLIHLDVQNMTSRTIYASSGHAMIHTDNGDGTIIIREFYGAEWRANDRFHNILELDLSTGQATELLNPAEVIAAYAVEQPSLQNRDSFVVSGIVDDLIMVAFENTNYGKVAGLWNSTSDSMIWFEESNVGFSPYVWGNHLFEFNGTTYVAGNSDSYGRAIFTFNETGWVTLAAEFTEYDLRFTSSTTTANGDIFFTNDDVITWLHDDNGTLELTDYDVDDYLGYGYLSHVHAMDDGRILIQFLEDAMAAIFDPATETFLMISGGYAPQVGDGDLWMLKASVINFDGATIYGGESGENEEYTTTSSSILYMLKDHVVRAFPAQTGYGWYTGAMEIDGQAISVAMDTTTGELVLVELDVGGEYSVIRGQA